MDQKLGSLHCWTHPSKLLIKGQEEEDICLTQKHDSQGNSEH